MIDNERRLYDLPGLESCSNLDYLWNIFNIKELGGTIIRNITKKTKIQFPKGGFNANKYEESEYIKATSLGKNDAIMQYLAAYFHYFDLKNYDNFLSTDEQEQFNSYLMYDYKRWSNEYNCYLLKGIYKVFYDNYVNGVIETTPNVITEIAILKECLDNYDKAKNSDGVKKMNAMQKDLEANFGSVFKKFDF